MSTLKGIEINQGLIGSWIKVLHSDLRYFTEGSSYEIKEARGNSVAMFDDDKDLDNMYELGDECSSLTWEWGDSPVKLKVPKTTKAQRKLVAASIRKAEGNLTKAIENAVNMGMTVIDTCTPATISFTLKPPKTEEY